MGHLFNGGGAFGKVPGRAAGEFIRGFSLALGQALAFHATEKLQVEPGNRPHGCRGPSSTIEGESAQEKK